MGRLLPALWLLALAGASARAHGQRPDAAAGPPPGAVRGKVRSSSLSWVRAPGAEACISTQGLARLVEQHIGPVFVPPAEADLSIEGLAVRSQTPPQFVVRVTVSDAGGRSLGSRELRANGDDCRVLDQATSLIIALAIDREAAFSALPPSLIANFDQGEDPAQLLLSELEGEPAPAAEPDAARPMRRPVLANQSPVEDTAGAEAGATRGTELELGVALGLLVVGERAFAPEVALGHPNRPLGVPVQLRVRYWLPQELEVANGVVTLSLLQAAVVACPLQLLDDWQLRGCLGLSGGLLFAAGSRFASDRNELRDAWGATAELHASAPITDAVSLALRFVGHLAFNPHSVEAPVGPNETLETVHETSRAALSANLGVVFAL